MVSRLIRSIYRGTLFPADKSLRENPFVLQKMNRSEELEDILSAKLSAENRIHLEEYIELQTDITLTAMEDRFIEGYRLGTHLLFEALCNPKQKVTRQSKPHR